MLHFRLRDYLSVLFYRVLAWRFGQLARRARIVWPLRIIGARHCHFGEDTMLQYGALVIVVTDQTPTPRLEVGRGSKIGHFAHIVCARDVRIGADVLVADRVFIADAGHGFRDPATPVLDQPLEPARPVKIGDGSWIGEGACILGCSIGRQTVIGANSVVTRDIPDLCVAAGAPARIVRRFCPETGAWRTTDSDGNFA